MPGCFRLGWQHGLLDEVLRVLGIGYFSEIEIGLSCMFDAFVGGLNVCIFPCRVDQ